MATLWVWINSYQRVKILIPGSSDLDDLCEAIKLKLPEFKSVGVHLFVIKSHENIILARNILISDLGAVTYDTALRAEIGTGSQSIDELMGGLKGLKVTESNHSSAMSFSNSPSLAVGFGTRAVLINPIETGKEMKDHFDDKRYWTYPDELMLDATFGEYTNLPRGGRVEQMHQLWISILKSNTGDKDKKGVLYFHGSPGIGKTYILRELYSRKVNDIPMDCMSQAEKVNFLVLEFNRGACTEICNEDTKLLIRKHPNLFAMSRLFWVNFADQDNLNWGTFIELVLIPMICANLSTLLLEFMMQYLKVLKIGKKCVILIDEILKTREIGVQFAEQVRSSICSWMGKMGVCDVVLFSTLDVKFMTDERTYSGRPVRLATTLPLLKVDESVALFRDQIKLEFANDEGTPVSQKEVLEMFALVTGGHPRSIQYIIEECNACIGSTRKLSLMNVIDGAAESLCAAYIEVSNWKRLIEVVLLAEKVKKEGRLNNDQTSEIFRTLVMSGVLVDSFDENDDEFVPVVPELFLHAWIEKNGSECLGDGARKLLHQILKLRSNFASFKYETLHSSWETLMRHIRQCDKLYKSIAFNDLYRLELRSDSTPATSCRVDGYSILKEIEYEDKTNILIQPNEIYNPSNKQNPGWDRMIVMEAFPLKTKSKRRYLLPVFIQNNFCEDSSTSKLSKAKVSKDLKSCLDFFNMYVQIDVKKFSFLSAKRKWFTSKPIRLESDCILLYVGEHKTNDNTPSDAPPNVMFCLGQDLQKLYGPTLMNFVDSLHPDEAVSVAA